MRFVMISHPDFDAPGAEGVEAAQEWVKELNSMIKKMSEDITTQGLEPELEKEAVATIKAHRVIIRKGDF